MKGQDEERIEVYKQAKDEGSSNRKGLDLFSTCFLIEGSQNT